VSEQDILKEPTVVNNNRTCGNCKHSWFILGQPTRECRRYPPQVFPMAQPRGLAFVTQFPMVKPDLCCGEFTPKLSS
jgi:hypothetical protein